MIQMNLLHSRLTDIENKLTVTKEGRCERRDTLEVWDQQIQTTVYKINKKVLLDSTGKHIHYPVINHNGKEYEKEKRTKSLCCIPETNTTVQINYTSVNKSKLKCRTAIQRSQA